MRVILFFRTYYALYWRYYLNYNALMTYKDHYKIENRLKNRLRALRKGLGLTQVQLSKKSGLSLRHIQDIEAGKIDIRITTLESLASALNVKAYQLICIEDTESIIQNKLDKKIECCKEHIITPYCPLDELNIAIQVCDEKGLILYTNAKCLEFHGVKRDELIKKYHIWDFLCSPKEKEDFKKYLKFIVNEQPEPTPYMNKNLTLKNEIIKVKIDWSYLKDPNGKIIGFFSILNKLPMD